MPHNPLSAHGLGDLRAIQWWVDRKLCYSSNNIQIDSEGQEEARDEEEEEEEEEKKGMEFTALLTEWRTQRVVSQSKITLLLLFASLDSVAAAVGWEGFTNSIPDWLLGYSSWAELSAAGV